jgi:hypothetical protein
MKLRICECGWDGGHKECIQDFDGIPLAERSFGRPRRIWEDGMMIA